MRFSITTLVASLALAMSTPAVVAQGGRQASSEVAQVVPDGVGEATSTAADIASTTWSSLIVGAVESGTSQAGNALTSAASGASSVIGSATSEAGGVASSATSAVAGEATDLDNGAVAGSIAPMGLGLGLTAVAAGMGVGALVIF